jgi:RNA polymerase sigma factor (sigma-70 family)
MSEDRSVTDLVARARNGDKQAWDDLVERFAPLVWSICRRHRLSDADADDVQQSVWLQLARQLDKIRDPAALAGWLAAATRRECGRVRNAASGPRARGLVPDPGSIADQQGGMAEQELLAAERHAALREALARLRPCCQQLIAMLLQDPPVIDTQISASLNIPAGNIGPRRSRCLDKLRRDPVIAALINAEAETARSELPGKRVHSHDERSRAS